MKRALEDLGSQLLVGVGRMLGRAVASGAKSVVKDVARASREVERRAKVAQKRIEDQFGRDHDDDHEWDN